MDCPKCGLYNLDHVPRCVRCGAALTRTALVAEDLTPPRAGKWKHIRNFYCRLRRKIGFRLDDGEVRDYLGESVDAVWTGNQFIARNIRFFPELFIPSLHQFRTGQKKTAWIFAGMFAGGLLGLVLFAGTIYWSWMLNLVVLTQVCSIFNIFPMRNMTVVNRFAFILILSLITYSLLFLFYQSMIYRGLNYYGIEFIQHTGFEAYGLERGTWIQFTRQEKYQRGDIIVIAVNVVRRGNQVIWGNAQKHVHMQWRNETFERILATPGQTVEIRDKKIYLDGSDIPSEIIPLCGTGNLPDAKFVLAKDEYFIWLGINVRQWIIDYSRVPERMIQGKVTRIIMPFWRRQIL